MKVMPFTVAGRRGPTRREEIIMTQDKARKAATRDSQRPGARGPAVSEKIVKK